MAEPIEIPKEPCTRWGADPQGEGGNFRGLSVPFKSIGNLHCSGRSNVTEAFTAKGIIQSPITSCSRRDHSVCPASTKYSENCLGPVDAAYRREGGCGIAQRG